MSTNSVHIEGKISKDPTIRYTASNLCWAQFVTVVEVEGKKARSYVPCKAFGEVAEELEKIGKKDVYVIIDGHIATGSYNAKDGHKVYTVDVIAESIDFSKGLLPDSTDQAMPEGFSELTEDFPF